MSESTVLVLIVATGLMLLIGIKNPVRLVIYLFLTWLLLAVFMEKDPNRAAGRCERAFMTSSDSSSSPDRRMKDLG